MSKLNCWEFVKCGREKNGINEKISGVCPVAAERLADGLNGGINGGRICWVVLDVHGAKPLRCSHMKDPCFSCEFRYKVMMEEGLLNVCKATGLFLKEHDKKDVENIVVK